MPLHFLLHWFWPPTADLMPPLRLLQSHRVSFQLSATGWLVEAGVLCAEPPHVHQRPAGGPLVVFHHKYEICHICMENLRLNESEVLLLVYLALNT